MEDIGDSCYPIVPRVTVSRLIVNGMILVEVFIGSWSGVEYTMCWIYMLGMGVWYQRRVLDIDAENLRCILGWGAGYGCLELGLGWVLDMDAGNWCWILGWGAGYGSWELVLGLRLGFCIYRSWEWVSGIGVGC